MSNRSILNAATGVAPDRSNAGTRVAYLDMSDRGNSWQCSCLTRGEIDSLDIRGSAWLIKFNSYPMSPGEI